MIFMDLVFIFGMTKEFTLDNGRKIKCMEKDRLYGRIKENIQG